MAQGSDEKLGATVSPGSAARDAEHDRRDESHDTREGRRARLIRFLVPCAITLASDQATKHWARAALGPEGSHKVQRLIGDTLSFRYAENPGIAFSMLRDMPAGRFVLAGLALIALVLVVRYLQATSVHQRTVHAALGFIGGGAIGNLIDRVIYSRVVDFILVDLDVWPANPWPVFNVADIALVVGVALIALDMVRGRRAAGQPPA
jgi:signal peptidase II